LTSSLPVVVVLRFFDTSLFFQITPSRVFCILALDQDGRFLEKHEKVMEL